MTHDEQAARVFVVDDDDAIRDSISLLLETVDIPCVAFSTATDFLDKFDPNAKGCLVLDIRMPKMSGLELQKHLIDSGSDMRIIFITAHEDIQARHKALEAGAIDFLKKPFGDRALMDAIQRALSSYSSSNEQIVMK